MENYIVLVILTPVIILSSFVKHKKWFLILNLGSIFLLFIYYSVMFYYEYNYSLDYMNNEEVRWMFKDATRIFNNILYHLISITSLLVINTLIFTKKIIQKDITW
jgi:hypothetical protein